MWLRFEDSQGASRSIVIDTSTDFRQQALRERIDRVDAVLFTHAHADHIFGLDDLRVFNFRQRQSIPCHSSAATIRTLRRTFAYAFEEGQEGGGKPKIDLIPIVDPFELFGLTIVPVPLRHGELEVLGFRVGSFAYLTDCNCVPRSSRPLLEGVETLIIDALRYRPHPTHFNVEQAIVAAREIGARRTWLTHLACEIDAADLRQPLPEGFALASDGLCFTVAADVAGLAATVRTP